VLVSPGTLNTVTVIFSARAPRDEPLGLGPGLSITCLAQGVAGVGQLLDVVVGVEHQQGVAEPGGGRGASVGVVEQLDQRRML
jgi:hypothetical protein